MNLSRHSPEETPSSNEEMSFRDLWCVLYDGWRLILGSLLATMTVAAVYLAMTQNQYEATMLLKIGQVGIDGNAVQIESVENVLERFKLPDFSKAILASLGWNGDSRERLYNSSFQVSTPRDKYVEIKFRGTTSEDARDAAEAILASIKNTHTDLMRTIIAKNEQLLATVLSEIVDTESLLKRLELEGKRLSSSDNHGILLWLQITQDTKNRLRTLRFEESVQREALNPALRIPTKLVGAMTVSGDPVYPKTRQAWLLAVIGGILLGVMLVAIRSLVNMRDDLPSEA